MLFVHKGTMNRNTVCCQLPRLTLHVNTGQADSKHDMFVMHWRGLLILFPLSAQPAASWQDMQQGRALPATLANGTAPVACRICIHASNAGIPDGTFTYVCTCCLTPCSWFTI